MFCEKCGAVLVDGKCSSCGVLSSQIKPKKPKKSNMLIFAIVLSVVSVGLLVGGFVILTSPKTIMLQSISSWSSSFKDVLVKSNDSPLMKKIATNDKRGLSGKMDIEINPSLGLDIDSISLDFSYNDDKKAKESNIALIASLGEQELVNLTSVLANNNIYINIKDIFDKYYYMEQEYISLIETSGTEIEEKLIDIVFNSFENNFSKEDIKKSKETITLGEKSKDVTKISYDVTSKNLGKVVLEILENVKKDTEIVEFFAELSEMDKKEIIDGIDEMIDDIKEDTEDEYLFTYNVYYYGLNNIVMEEIGDDEVVIQYYHYDNTKEFKVVEVDSKTNLLVVKVEGKEGKYDISGFLVTYAFSGSYSKNANKASLDLTVELEDKQKFTINMTGEDRENKDSFENKGEISLSVTSNGVSVDDVITIATDLSYTFGKKVDTTGIENATAIDEMTEDEMNAIMLKLEQHPLYSLLESLYGFDEPELDYDYDYDDDYDYDYDDDWSVSLDDSSL